MKFKRPVCLLGILFLVMNLLFEISYRVSYNLPLFARLSAQPAYPSPHPTLFTYLFWSGYKPFIANIIISFLVILVVSIILVVIVESIILIVKKISQKRLKNS